MWRWFDIFVSNQSNLIKYYKKPPIDRTMDKSLDFEDVSGAFYLLVLGLIISTIVFLCEKWYYRILQQKMKADELKKLCELKSKSEMHFRLNPIQKEELNRFALKLSK